MPIYKVNGMKKDGLQKYNVRVNFCSNDGKARQLTRAAYGLETAKDLERQLTNSINTENKILESKMTVKQLYDKFIDIKKYEIRESSLEKYQRTFKNHILPTMANVRLDKLSSIKLEEWKLEVERKGL
jgi:hypothetical protein